nr:MAG TPA: hypothetical protein [Caudoviricetes sp.]DAU88213.1 MAG TPA: hypothetical protein [Caudoviricetes sp.]
MHFLVNSSYTSTNNSLISSSNNFIERKAPLFFLNNKKDAFN